MEDRFNKDVFSSLLKTEWIGHSMQYFEKVYSTQSYAHTWAQMDALQGSIVLAEKQTHGRGRLGRVWESPSCSGIWISIILRPSMPLMQASHFTILSSVAVIRSLLSQTGLKLKIKWPNDILYDGKKVCGILTEARGSGKRVQYIVLGIGINVNVTLNDFPEYLHSKATSLAIAGGTTYPRMPIIASLLKELEDLYEEYFTAGFKSIQHLWESYSDMIGKGIQAQTSRGLINGVVKGLDPMGALLLKTEYSLIPIISSDSITFL